MDNQHIINQLEKMPSEFTSAETRLNFLLSQDLPKRTRKLIEKYLETIKETHEEFFRRIKKSL